MINKVISITVHCDTDISEHGLDKFEKDISDVCKKHGFNGGGIFFEN